MSAKGSEPVHVLSEGRPSLDLFWPRDVVGRTLQEHQPVGHGELVRCRGCDVVVTDFVQHQMFALVAAIEKLRNRPPAATQSHQDGGDRGLGTPESSIVWERPGGDAA